MKGFVSRGIEGEFCMGSTNKPFNENLHKIPVQLNWEK